MKPPADSTSAPCRLIAVGAGIRATVTGDSGLGNYAKLVGVYNDIDGWLEDETPAEAEVVVASCPSLFSETVGRITAAVERGDASRVVIVYDYAQAETVSKLSNQSRAVTALRAPVTAAEIREACEADIALATLRECSAEADFESGTTKNDEIPPRQFTDEQLAEISQISTAIDCECPHHLASLLSSLNAFEAYSRDCESRDEADAMLHAYLHRSTAKARSTIEDALVVLAEAEGIEV